MSRVSTSLALLALAVLGSSAQGAAQVLGLDDRIRPFAVGRGLDYSTFLGGDSDEIAEHLAVDRTGHAYVIGFTFSESFPTTAGVYDRTFNGVRDVFVTKLNARGSALAYSTFIGGAAHDYGWGIAVDRDGNAYVTGQTESLDFPTTAGAFDRTHNGRLDVFVAKLSADGSDLQYSTFLGGPGSEFDPKLAVDRMGRASVGGATQSPDFPTTPGAFDRTYNGGDADTFVTRLNTAGSALAYSTFLGGAAHDGAGAFAVDRSGLAYLSGSTNSADFPTTAGAFDRTLGGPLDAFVTKLDATGNALAYSTFLGGADVDVGLGIAVDRAGEAHLTGHTSSADFPTTAGAYDRSFNGPGLDAFVTKLNDAGGGLRFSTFLGGSEGAGVDVGKGIAVDRGGVWTSGFTSSPDFPTTVHAFDRTHNGGADVFVARLNARGAALRYSTFVGGRRYEQSTALGLDGQGAAYVTGFTISRDFPTTPGAFDGRYNGAPDAIVMKLELPG